MISVMLCIEIIEMVSLGISSCVNPCSLLFVEMIVSTHYSLTQQNRSKKFRFLDSLM